MGEPKKKARTRHVPLIREGPEELEADRVGDKPPKKYGPKRAEKRNRAASKTLAGTLYYGDNLDVLRRHIADESVDLVYLDPPFQSGKDYNILFEDRSGAKSTAQIKAFEDTWRWGIEAEQSYQDIVESGGPIAPALRALRAFLGESDMMAYLSMMAPRLVELRRVMKLHGTIYLHCDSNASHYLKMLMDGIFGPEHFHNELIWKRTNARSTPGRWPRIHDVILFYSRSDDFYHKPVKAKADKAKLPHTLVTGEDGKKYQTYELTGAGTSEGETGKPWRGYDPTSMGRHWGNLREQMDKWDAEGLIHWPKKGSAGGFPRRRAAEPFDPDSRMVTVGDVWTDIDRLNQTAKERLGYPTQKPETLLERIILASSRENGVVLDPFCGCGTTVAAAQKLGRSWIGIDITHLAIGLIKHRIRGAFINAQFEVIGEPVTIEGARQLAEEDRYQFQWWILGLVGARGTEQKKGADRGVDGRLYFHEKGRLSATRQIIFSVKAGKTGVSHVRDLRGVIEREKAEIGALLTLNPPTKAMLKEATSAGFFESAWGRHPRIQILTAEELLSGRQLDYPAPKYSNVTHRKVLRVEPPSKEEQLAFEGIG